MKKLLLLFGVFAHTGVAQIHPINGLKRTLYSLQKQSDGYTKDTLVQNALNALMCRKEMGDSIKPLGYYEKAPALSCEIESADLEGSVLLRVAEGYLRQQKWAEALSLKMYGNKNR